MKVLVTGGAGYIGSTICLALEEAGHTPVILDSLFKGYATFARARIFYHGDIGNQELIQRIFQDHRDISLTIHCAARILVPESQAEPYDYYTENVSKSLLLFRSLLDCGCRKVIFSSSTSIYEENNDFIVQEQSPKNPKSPYARTKWMVEMILEDMCAAYGMQAVSLRYFNPIGADPKGRSGPYIQNDSHILDRLLEVYLAHSPMFYVTGTTWPTRDGSGVRDYIHVWDLAQAHLQAVERFSSLCSDKKSYCPINLGSGSGTTVYEFIRAFEEATNSSIPCEARPPRPGDTAGSYASVDKSRIQLGWKTTFSVSDGIRHALAWAKKQSLLQKENTVKKDDFLTIDQKTLK